ncbi:MAG: TRAP transporter small permease [Pseudomonadota bacterium]
MHTAMLRLAQGMAVLGGTVLSLLILMTCVSIVGREIGLGPIPGDFEMVEAGVAFAIFAFIPLCQITSGHATVDIFANRFPPGLSRIMRAVTELVFALVLILIAWRLGSGTLSKLNVGETSFILQFPVWWAFGASFAGSVIAAFVGVYMAGVRIAEAAQGRPLIPEGEP